MGTCRTHGRLLHFGPVTWLRLFVWMLDIAKCFSLTLNIFVVFEQIASASIRYSRAPPALQIPHVLEGFPLPVWGSAPTEFFSIANKKYFQVFFFLERCTAVRWDVFLLYPLWQIGVLVDYLGLGVFSIFWNFSIASGGPIFLHVAHPFHVHTIHRSKWVNVCIGHF